MRVNRGEPTRRSAARRVEEPFFHTVVAPDGTRLEAWTNDPDLQIDGPTVLLCNGLGTNPWSMPALLDPDCGVRVISWSSRGCGGSARPADRDRVTVSDFVDDAFAVLAWAGLERVTLMGWSVGVNVAFEFAQRHPERVDGIFAVAGVPGDICESVLAPLLVPRPLRPLLAWGAVHATRLAGPLLSPVARRIPIGPRLAWLLGHTGLMFPLEHPESSARAMREFLRTPLDWYFHLAAHCLRHAPVDLAAIDVPTMLVAGRWDLLASAPDMASAAAELPDGRFVELNGSHFLAMEQPDEVHALLLDFLGRLDRDA